MLQAAALDAVRRARYRPFLLNGQPTEVQTTITIHFTMND
jgi:protein TonB